MTRYLEAATGINDAWSDCLPEGVINMIEEPTNAEVAAAIEAVIEPAVRTAAAEINGAWQASIIARYGTTGGIDQPTDSEAGAIIRRHLQGKP
jgi:hypothetical protein